MDEFSRGEEPGRFRSVHFGSRLCQGFDVMIYLNNGLIRIRNPNKKYVKGPVNRKMFDGNNIPVFLDRKLKLQPVQAVVAIFRMKNLNSLSDIKQVSRYPTHTVKVQ